VRVAAEQYKPALPFVKLLKHANKAPIRYNHQKSHTDRELSFAEILKISEKPTSDDEGRLTTTTAHPLVGNGHQATRRGSSVTVTDCLKNVCVVVNVVDRDAIGDVSPTFLTAVGDAARRDRHGSTRTDNHGGSLQPQVR
jgi:hypothetical protein